MTYSDRDLARIALAVQAQELADQAAALAAGPGHDAEAGIWAGTLGPAVLEAAHRLRDLAVAYERSRGATWAELGAATGLPAAEAERRWAAITPPPLADPARAATGLDAWVVRRATITTPPIPNPFSQLLDASAGPIEDCVVCRKFAGGVTPLWMGPFDPPGGYLVDDDHWRVFHAPVAAAPAGALLIISRRHYFDFTEMTPDEAASYAPLMGRLCEAMRQATGAEKVHVFSNMEGAPHFHVWLFPRRAGDPRGRQFMASLGTCSPADAAAAIERIRAVL
jgi:diadenosine tetraphosphate (Ap4A) HIT family hydrolase